MLVCCSYCWLTLPLCTTFFFPSRPTKFGLSAQKGQSTQSSSTEQPSHSLHLGLLLPIKIMFVLQECNCCIKLQALLVVGFIGFIALADDGINSISAVGDDWVMLALFVACCKNVNCLINLKNYLLPKMFYEGLLLIAKQHILPSMLVIIVWVFLRQWLHYITKVVCSNTNSVPIGGRFALSSGGFFERATLSEPHSCSDLSILLFGLVCLVNQCRSDDQSFHSK